MKFTETIRIAKSRRTIFEYTQDYKNRLSWDTFLVRAELIGGASEAGKGEKAYCVAKNGLGMETEYLTFLPPRVTAIRMTNGPYLFKTFVGTWLFKELGSSETEVSFIYTFTLRFPFNLFGFYVKYNLRNNVKQRLRDLKHCLEK